MSEKINWKKPTTDIANYRYIVAIYKYICDEDGECELMDLLKFNGINNHWEPKNAAFPKIKYKDIISWIPISKD